LVSRRNDKVAEECFGDYFFISQFYKVVFNIGHFVRLDPAQHPEKEIHGFEQYLLP
jgi:hypothetical protein